VFDQESNPDGLQRDLSKKHAAEAYDYVARDRKPTTSRAPSPRSSSTCATRRGQVEPIKLPADVPVQLVKLTSTSTRSSAPRR
jgi:hypothetical protein